MEARAPCPCEHNSCVPVPGKPWTGAVIYDGRGCFRRAVVGILSPGLITRADSNPCGKSLGFSVTMKSARPVSAQAQNGSSPGSGEMSGRAGATTTSASSRSRLMIFPISARRMFNLAITPLYSATISSVRSQANVSSSIQSRSSLALGFRGTVSADFSPAIPATRTEVSTTPLGRFLFCVGNDRDLRQLLSSRAAFTDHF
jgi:hypothetical protein